MEGSLHKASSGKNFRNARRMRKEATDAEEILWRIVRGKQIGGCKFRRQHPIGAYIADFYCHKLKLVIELDGGYHQTEVQKENDAIRDRILQDRGITSLRITNEALLQNTEHCIAYITSTIEHIKRNNDEPGTPHS